MAIDQYAPCPCGSDKKLKFCCHDLAADIEKIMKFAQSDQLRAAQQHVEQVMTKNPDRASLLDIRAMLEMRLEDLDAAEKTVTHYLQRHPRSANAHAHAASLAAARQQPAVAVAKLQDAFELLDEEVSERVYETIGEVGDALLRDGDIIGARGHFLFFHALAPAEDNRGLEMLLQLNLRAKLPLVLRDDIHLEPLPEGDKDAEKFRDILHTANRGLWRRAAAELETLIDRDQPQPRLLLNSAVLHGWLGDRSGCLARLRKYSQLDVPLDDAVEVEALAQLIDDQANEPRIDSLCITYPIRDEDELTTRLAGDRSVERYDQLFEQPEQDEEAAPRPRASYMLFDRPAPRSGVDLTWEAVPNVYAFLAIYGKRTDRDARLEVTTDRNQHLAEVERLVAQLGGEALGPAEGTEVVGDKLATTAALSWRWRLPNDTPPEQRRKLLAQRRRQAYCEDWVAAPQGALGGLSLREVAPWPKSQIPALAAILLVEQGAADAEERELFQDLRRQLGLPLSEPIDPSSIDASQMPLMRIPRVELGKLSNDSLVKLFRRAAFAGDQRSSALLAAELVSRPSVTKGLDDYYRRLISVETESDRALRWIAEAKSRSGEMDNSPAEWVLMELEIQIERQDAQGVQAALNELRTNYFHEQGVAEATYQLLYATGLINPETAAQRTGAGGASLAGAGVAAAASPAAANRIWTPDQEAAPVGGGKSAIWTP